MSILYHFLNTTTKSVKVVVSKKWCKKDSLALHTTIVLFCSFSCPQFKDWLHYKHTYSTYPYPPFIIRKYHMAYQFVILLIFTHCKIYQIKFNEHLYDIWDTFLLRRITQSIGDSKVFFECFQIYGILKNVQLFGSRCINKTGSSFSLL